MLVEKSNTLSNNRLILSKDLPNELDMNFLDVVFSEERNILVLIHVFEKKLKIFVKSSEIPLANFLTGSFGTFIPTMTNKTYYFLKKDEELLSLFFRKYKLPIIKEWYMGIKKIIDNEQSLNFSEELLNTIEFELSVFEKDEFKRSDDFYFIELLLQRLEKRISFSKIKGKIQFSQITNLIKETDYRLCFTHSFPKSNQLLTEIRNLDIRLVEKLKTKGIYKLYKYQNEVLEKILNNKNVIITAPTGNGKTESFLLPILHKLLYLKEHGLLGIKAILFYPTKALASDQLAKINFFTQHLNIFPIQLDSDVSQKDREEIYRKNQFDILITTPDLIHYSLYKESFKKFIINTKIIVFDEVHIYTGLFGTNVYYFLRRLERILKEGSQIQYIGSSATIKNPVEFTSKLFEKQMNHIDCQTPKKNKTDLYCIQRDKKVNRYDALLQLVTILVQSEKDEKIIIFRNSQQESEKSFDRLRLILNKKIALHRAGLSREQRRTIEKELRKNKIDIVVTTTTLEVGIDIGGITTIITPIVPVNRLLQRIGRAGRGEKPSKIFLELNHDPIAYYYSTHAESYLKDISPVNITTDNRAIAIKHGSLLIREQLPISDSDKRIFKEITNEPGRPFSLRNVADMIEVKTERGYKVTEKELPMAFYEFFPFNYILHNSRHYQIIHIERSKEKKLMAIVKPLKEKFNHKQKIKPIIEKKVFTNSSSVEIDYIDGVEIKLANCKVRLEYQGNIINFKEHVLLETYDYEYASRCVIFNFEDKMNEYMRQERNNRVELGSIVHTFSHVLYKSAKMIIYCGNDLINMENSIGMWKVIFVDSAVNGNGMSELLFEKRAEIWERALQLLHACNCKLKEGCLYCTMNYSCHRRNKGLLKDFN